MSRWDWLKVIVLILIPINAWLGMFYYLHWKRQKAWEEKEIQALQDQGAVAVRYFTQKHLGIKKGQRLSYPFPYPARLLGKQPPFGKGYPVLFINISWIASLEVWQPTIQEALNTSPNLYVVLLYRKPKGLPEGWKPIMEIVQAFSSPRLSVLASEDNGTNWMRNFFGTELDGFLLFLCDGQGIIQHIEPYPKLRHSRFWEKEVADWRPKLHQAVKRALEKFYGKTAGMQGR